jgi:hypothetical protein
MRMDEDVASAKKRKSGIPTGNAGEYFVMGELLRRGYEAQLADRNTKGYDLSVGLPGDRFMTKVQVKSVRQQPWFVRVSDFEGSKCDQFTIQWNAPWSNLFSAGPQPKCVKCRKLAMACRHGQSQLFACRRFVACFDDDRSHFRGGQHRCCGKVRLHNDEARAHAPSRSLTS